jgi:hypothetical protein
MTSEGLGELFKGESADTCAGKFLFLSIKASIVSKQTMWFSSYVCCVGAINGWVADSLVRQFIQVRQLIHVMHGMQFIKVINIIYVVIVYVS